MPFRINLTKAVLESIEPPETGRLVLHDSKVRGLTARVTSNGAISFSLFRRINGRPARITVGKFPTVTVEQARKQAEELNGEVAKGADPQAAKRARRGETTFKELWEWWLDTHAKEHRRTWREDERRYKAHLAAWDSRRLSEIKLADVQALHVRIGKNRGKCEANRVLGLLRALFNKATVLGFEKPNPTRGVHKYAEKSRERFLQTDELPRFFKALDAEEPVFRDFFKITILTGARRGNVQAMRWADVNLDHGTWRIPTTKTDPYTVALAPEAVAILHQRKAEANGSEWAFASRGKTGHLVEPKEAWKRICKAAGLEDLRIHDLRRTLGSWQAAAGTSLAIIGKSLGHKNQATTAIYARLNLDPVRESVEKATAAIMAAASVKVRRSRRASRTPARRNEENGNGKATQ